MQRFASSAALALAIAASSVSAQSSTFPEGVIASGTMGTTNPAQPTLGTTVNQTSVARLLSLNSVDDWCIFAPPENNTIGESEVCVRGVGEELLTKCGVQAIEVAWCTKARNNARVIPDGVVTGVSFLKTDFYVQIYGYGDLTQLNIASGDYGGELDPHGATGAGNPVGGNVTTNVTGSDINIAEWMQFVSYTQFCIRACTNANSSYSAASMCEHKLDEMGCTFVMPGNYDFNGTFETCDADVAYPPGWYPVVAGGTTSYSTFAQYFTGTYTDNGATVSYTVGDTVTPSTVAFTPASSNCQTTATISNGLAVATHGSSSGSSGSSNGSSGGSGSGSSSRTGKSCLRLSGYVFSKVIQRAGRQRRPPATPLFP
ncbi:hypothetical protein ARMSODRAFT_293836 [Armillaria solidipes]|uniref:Macrofage activating glyco protein n=1 Tax=Armillaria solidipes TaxID=1076256 RepID=A0A2H3BM69_9AGAR|nr:hypothetical protein ARMSODRAFT_293836 [Armillaria solidipes]